MIGWGENKLAKELKKTQLMARLMEKSGSAVKEVKLEKGGKWGPHHMYVFKGLDGVLGVEDELEY